MIFQSGSVLSVEGQPPTHGSEDTDAAAPAPGPADNLGEDAKALYERIPVDGTAVSNKAVRVALGWESEPTAERYFSVRDRLEDGGLVIRGRGRGGTVRRVLGEADAEWAQAAAEGEAP